MARQRQVRRRARQWWLVALAGLWLAAAGAGAAAGQALGDYELGIGDRVAITVFGHDDLSGEFVVGPNGKLTLPLLGQVAAKDATVDRLREAVTAAYNRDYLVNPSINIEVVNYRPFFILGEVENPGQYTYINGMNVRQAVALAGGFTRRARSSQVTVIRETPDGQITLPEDLDGLVIPGDTIEVERRLF